MPLIENKILIQAPIELCFDLARNVEIHQETVSFTKEKAVAGVVHGLLEEGDIVTWEGIHFGIKQRLTAKITHMNRPYEFTDEMVKGAFKSFQHVHKFIETEHGTMMVDQFQYISPFGLVGKIADFLFLERYMKRFITKRAEELKRIAEQTVK